MLKDEIIDRAKKDQELRLGIQNPQNTSITWDDINARDKENIAWLKKIVKKEGWPTISKVGAEASHAAWLIVQHADLDVDFQEFCLNLLKQAWENNDVNPQNLAYLTDRVAVNRHEAQTYGTQFKGTVTKDLIPQPIRDIENLDRRRSSMGLESFDVYSQKMRGEYKGKRANKKIGGFYRPG